MSNPFCKFYDMIINVVDLFRWSETEINISTNTINNLNKFEKTLMNTVTCSPKTELKVAKNFKRISPIPIQIWLSKTDNIQIHEYIEMWQDLSPKSSTYWSLVILIYWACEWQGCVFLVLRLKCSNGKCAKLHTMAASNNKGHPTRSLYICLFAQHMYWCCSSRTSRLGWIEHSTHCQLRDCSNIPFILQRRHQSHVVFVKVAHNCDACNKGLSQARLRL